MRGIGRSPAILLKNHGVFTIGPTAEAAVKAAVMAEDIAATVWPPSSSGDAGADSPTTSSTDSTSRYTTAYGQ